jgi:hypothetical protein
VRASWAILIALGVAFAVVVLSGSGSEAVSGRLGGDYPSFYAAGQVLVEDPSELYDVEAQARAQAGLFGADTDGGQLYFAYPSVFAIPYAGLAQLPYRASYVVHTLFMVGLLVLGLHLLRPLVSLIDRHFLPCVVASLVFYPMFTGVTGGQNTAVTFVLLAWFFRALADDEDVAAGLAVGLLLFKPQYALPLIGLLLVVRRWRAAGVALAGGVVVYLVGAALQGWGWGTRWLDTVRWLAEVDAPFNTHNAVSWLGVAEAVFGVGSAAAIVVGWSLALATAGALAVAWHRDRLRHPALVVALTVPAILLIAPHAIYYDAGILLMSLAVLSASVERSGAVRWAVAGLYLVAVAQVWSPTLGVSPVWLVVLAVLAWAAVTWCRAMAYIHTSLTRS